MIKLSKKQQEILTLFMAKGQLQSSQVHQEMKQMDYDISLVTIKRDLSKLANQDVLKTTGSGRSTKYKITAYGRIFTSIDAHSYCLAEPDKRFGLDKFNFDVIAAFPSMVYSQEELSNLEKATKNYHKKTKDLSPAIQQKELERLVIELAWKSSKIEGNTYTLLDTEKLIRENKEAPGHSKKEAQMILNHKGAFQYIYDNSSQFKQLTTRNLEQLHSILVKDMNVSSNFREKPVGVVGSKYQPLDNVYQVKEAVNVLTKTIEQLKSPYAKAMIALLGISYIQPFDDGNKRTSRLMANAILLAHNCAPLSYRSVDEKEYREAMLVFYELNSIMPFKKIFFDQYLFATENYAIK